MTKPDIRREASHTRCYGLTTNLCLQSNASCVTSRHLKSPGCRALFLLLQGGAAQGLRERRRRAACCGAHSRARRPARRRCTPPLRGTGASRAACGACSPSCCAVQTPQNPKPKWPWHSSDLHRMSSVLGVRSMILAAYAKGRQKRTSAWVRHTRALCVCPEIARFIRKRLSK